MDESFDMPEKALPICPTNSPDLELSPWPESANSFVDYFDRSYETISASNDVDNNEEKIKDSDIGHLKTQLAKLQSLGMPRTLQLPEFLFSCPCLGARELRLPDEMLEIQDNQLHSSSFLQVVQIPPDDCQATQNSLSQESGIADNGQTKSSIAVENEDLYGVYDGYLGRDKVGSE